MIMDIAIFSKRTGLVEALISLESLEGFNPGDGLDARDVTGQSVNIGWRWSGSKFVGERPFGDIDLEAYRLEARKKVDHDAETARIERLTPGLGQTLAYQAKAEEVRRYDQDTNPVKADYPYMSAEIGVTGDSLTAVADAVRSAVAVWAEKGPEIERTRLKAKSDIAKAETVDRIQAIVSAIEWP